MDAVLFVQLDVDTPVKLLTQLLEWRTEVRPPYFLLVHQWQASQYTE